MAPIWIGGVVETAIQILAFQPPVAILFAKTADFMMGTHKWHGVAPNEEQTETALEQLEETLGDY